MGTGTLDFVEGIRRLRALEQELRRRAEQFQRQECPTDDSAIRRWVEWHKILKATPESVDGPSKAERERAEILTLRVTNTSRGNPRNWDQDDMIWPGAAEGARDCAEFAAGLWQSWQVRLFPPRELVPDQPPPDGPSPPNQFNWKGKSENLPPTAYKLLNAMWGTLGKSNQSRDFRTVADEVWGPNNAKTARDFGNHISNVNNVLATAEFPNSLHRKGDLLFWE